MFRTTVRADENTNVDQAVADLKRECDAAKIASPVVDAITIQLRDVLEPLVERGRSLASLGSQMNVSRDLTGDGFIVKILFGVNLRRSILNRLIDKFRSR